MKLFFVLAIIAAVAALPILDVGTAGDKSGNIQLIRKARDVDVTEAPSTVTTIASNNTTPVAPTEIPTVLPTVNATTEATIEGTTGGAAGLMFAMPVILAVIYAH